MEVKEFKKLLARVPKAYQMEPMVIITDPTTKKVMFVPISEVPKDEAPKVESKSNPVGFA